MSDGLLLWLAWPLIHFAFGTLIAPIVMPYYNAGIAGLRIPAPGTIVAVQMIRGLVFLAASLPDCALEGIGPGPMGRSGIGAREGGHFRLAWRHSFRGCCGSRTAWRSLRTRLHMRACWCCCLRRRRCGRSHRQPARVKHILSRSGRDGQIAAMCI